MLKTSEWLAAKTATAYSFDDVRVVRLPSFRLGGRVGFPNTLFS